MYTCIHVFIYGVSASFPGLSKEMTGARAGERRRASIMSYNIIVNYIMLYCINECIVYPSTYYSLLLVLASLWEVEQGAPGASGRRKGWTTDEERT